MNENNTIDITTDAGFTKPVKQVTEAEKACVIKNKPVSNILRLFTFSVTLSRWRTIRKPMKFPRRNEIKKKTGNTKVPLSYNNLVYGKNPLCEVDNFHISHL